MSNSSSPLCPRCGAPLAGGSVEGLCAQCLGALNFAAETVFTADAEASAHKAPPLSPEQLAPHFPQLEILECLGRGGMGGVYKAQQKSLNRLVALKLLAPERANDAEFAKRFVREAQALAALNHPHIVTIYDFGREGGFYFLLMEFVDGVNLRQAMSAKRFTPEQALAVVPSVCEALQYAHAHGIVHRDIKPENLLLDKEGRVKIADFGVAKMLGEDGSPGLAESQPAGTPQYMAPEQKEHQRTDHRTDIYSLGVVLYEMLTGELPADKLQPPSRKVQIDVRLDEIVLRALEKKPELRYQTAVEMKTRLDDLSAPASRKVLPKSVWKKWAVLQIAGTAIVSTLAACCWHFHTARDMPVMRTGSLCMFLGLLFYSTALPMALGMMPMNATFGFRIRDSFESEERWYDVNAHFGRHLLAWCWLIIGLGAIAFFTSAPTAYASRALLLALAATLTPILLCKSWAAETSSRVPKPRLGPLRVYEILAFIGLAATSAQLLVARPQNVQPPKTAMGAVSTPASNDPRYTGLAVIGIPQPMDANSTFVAVANGTVVVDGSASVETWSPTLAPGEKPDLQKIIADTRELISHGRYEEALQRALWFHYHGLEVDPGYSAVRLSFGLANWTELARRYPKARQAMIEVRDRDTRAFAAGHGYSDLFMEVVALNKSLRDEAATQTLFKSIEQTDPALAKQCAIIVASAGKDHEAQTVGVSPTKPPELHHLQLLKRFTFDDPTISSEVVAGTDNKGIRRWLLSGSDRNILMRGLDELLKKHGEQDPEVVAQRARIEARARLVAQPRVVRLYEVANPNVEDCTVLYRAKLMAKDLEGRAYLEMWCRLPGSGEYFSRGLNQTVSGSNDWVSCETPFFLKKGEKPDLIRLNVAIDGEGEVYARDIELSTMASPNAP